MPGTQVDVQETEAVAVVIGCVMSQSDKVQAGVTTAVVHKRHVHTIEQQFCRVGVLVASFIQIRESRL